LASVVAFAQTRRSELSVSLEKRAFSLADSLRGNCLLGFVNSP